MVNLFCGGGGLIHEFPPPTHTSYRTSEISEEVILRGKIRLAADNQKIRRRGIIVLMRVLVVTLIPIVTLPVVGSARGEFRRLVREGGREF